MPELHAKTLFTVQSYVCLLRFLECLIVFSGTMAYSFSVSYVFVWDGIALLSYHCQTAGDANLSGTF